MMPRQHAALSLGMGLLGLLWSGKPAVVPASLVAGVLVDIDHMADYAWYSVTGEHRLLLLLHGYELALPLWWLTARWLGPRAAVIVTLAYLLHLITDERYNRTRPGAYSLLWRVRHGFRLEALSSDPKAGIQGRLDDLALLRSVIQKLTRNKS